MWKLTNALGMPAYDAHPTGKERRLKPIVLLPQCILVSVAGLFCHGFGIVGGKTSRVPLLHLNHGVIVISQSLFGSKRSYPTVDSRR